MGLSLKKIGKSLGKAVKSVTKVVSTKNIVGLATGDKSITSLGKEVISRAVSSTKSTSKNVSVSAGSKTFTGTPANAAVFADAQLSKGIPVQVSDANTGQPLSKTAAPKTGVKDTVKDAAKAGLSGVLASLAAKLGLAPTTGEIGANALDSTLNEWLKRHWWKLVLIPVAIWGLPKLLSNKPKKRW